MKNIGIIGLGETGATILSILNETFSKVVFNVYDPADWVLGRLYDLEHAAAYKKNVIRFNDFNDAENCDYWFFCAGIRNTKDGDRMDEIESNKQLIATIFSDLKIRDSSKIINLTNPVELISEWIYDYFDGANCVVGTGTGLDYYRLKSIVAKKFAVSPCEVDIPVIGEHGQWMLPLYSSGRIENKKADEYLTNAEQIELTKTLKAVAKTIRRTEEATKYGVAQCAVNLLKGFDCGGKKVHYVSRLVEKKLKQKLNIDGEIFLSLPTRLSQNGIETFDLPSLSLYEFEELKASAQKLHDIYQSKS